jgi:S1-C subfamily serine protease
MIKKLIALCVIFVAFGAGALIASRFSRQAPSNAFANVKVGDGLTAKAISGGPTPLDLNVDDSPISDPGAIARAAAIVKPAVVTINTATNAAGGYSDNMWGAPATQNVPLGTGSGVIISPNGLIVTNNHVIRGATSIMVTLSNGQNLPGTVVGADPLSDIALVKVNATGLPAATLGDSSKLVVGQWVIAVGDPLRVGTTVTEGIVSAMHNSSLPPGQDGELSSYIQTDAPINPGNSGGALADTKGRIIGINTAIISNTGGSVGIGYAIPINSVKRVIKQLAATGTVNHPWLGLMFGPIATAIRQQNNIPASVQGLLVVQIVPGSPAESGGLQPGDIITAVNGTATSSPGALQSIIANGSVGQKLSIVVWRNGSNVTVPVTLGQHPVPNQSLPQG